MESRYYGAESKVNDAVRFLEDKARFCGISTNRGLRYVPTRAIPGVPALVIFFHFDEEALSACLVHIKESPRNYRDDEEAI
jgi:hypothetical protein